MDQAKLFLSSFGGDAPGPDPDPGDPIARSVRFTDGQVLTRSQTGTRFNADIFCFSAWVKPNNYLPNENSILVFGDSSPEDFIVSLSNGGQLMWRQSGGYVAYNSAQYLRDSAAWYHIYVEYDSNKRTSLWVNGVRSPNQGQMVSCDRSINLGAETNTNGSSWFDGYMAEVYMIQGQHLGWTTFARYNAFDVIVPVRPQGLTYGDNGFHLEFQETDIADLGVDSSPNSNHLTPKGFDGVVAGYSSDTPTNNTSTGMRQQPFNSNWQRAGTLISTANTMLQGCQTAFAMPPNTGKYYWEVRSSDTGGNFAMGMTRGKNNASWGDNGWYWSPPINQLQLDGSGSLSNYAADPTWATNWIWQFAYDSDTQECWIGRNGVWLAVSGQQPGDPVTGERPFANTANALLEGATYFPGSFGSGSGTTGYDFYFDPLMWQEECPEGFNPLSSSNVAYGSTILNGRDHFRALTGPGSGADGTAQPGQIAGGWSQYLTVSGYYQNDTTLYAKTNAFNGNTDGAGFTSEADGNWAFAPATPIPVTSSVTVYQANTAGTTSWNGQDLTPNATFITFNGSGEISQASPITSTTAGSGGQSCFLYAIVVDGEILVDYGILPNAQATFPQGLWWIKDRTAAGQHQLVDSVRGLDQALTTPAKGGNQEYSFPGGTSVAWCWDASDPERTGFNIITYTGNGVKRTIPTGLEGDTDCVLIKAYAGTDVAGYLANSNWIWWNKDMPDDQFFYWQQGSQIVPSTGFFDGNPAQNGPGTLTVATDPDTNGSSAYGLDYVAYCWTEVPGFSKFGTYEGNASSDGPFIHCGFKPALIMIRPQGTSDGHFMIDTTRGIYNPYPSSLLLTPAAPDAESTWSSRDIDILSNGFKIRSNSASINGGTVTFAAWAENPFESPVTAR